MEMELASSIRLSECQTSYFPTFHGAQPPSILVQPIEAPRGSLRSLAGILHLNKQGYI